MQPIQLNRWLPGCDCAALISPIELFVSLSGEGQEIALIRVSLRLAWGILQGPDECLVVILAASQTPFLLFLLISCLY